MKEKDMLALMGKVVTFNSVLNACYDDRYERREYEVTSLRNPVAGWVVGFKWLREGVVTRYFEDGSNFRTTKSIPAVVISPWPTKKHVLVPLDSFELGGEPVPPKRTWSERDKEIMRVEMKTWPRDAKGKWVKK